MGSGRRGIRPAGGAGHLRSRAGHLAQAALRYTPETMLEHLERSAPGARLFAAVAVRADELAPSASTYATHFTLAGRGVPASVPRGVDAVRTEVESLLREVGRGGRKLRRLPGGEPQVHRPDPALGARAAWLHQLLVLPPDARGMVDITWACRSRVRRAPDPGLFGAAAPLGSKPTTGFGSLVLRKRCWTCTGIPDWTSSSNLRGHDGNAPIVLMKDRRREMIPVDKIHCPQLAHAG
jgi:hypothetical protein